MRKSFWGETIERILRSGLTLVAAIALIWALALGVMVVLWFWCG
jgi:hypothetical protein